MISINNLKCYGSSVIVKLIEREGYTCSGQVIYTGTTSTITLKINDIVYFNYNHIASEIIIDGDQVIAIQHWKIIGYKRPTRFGIFDERLEEVL